MAATPQKVTVYRGKRPKIVWGAYTLLFRYALDNAVAYPEEGAGGQKRRTRSGEEDSWSGVTRWLLAGDVAFIPSTDDAAATGWDGAAGWRAFLEYAWAGGTFDFYPDADDAASGWPALLVEPSADDAEPEVEEDYTRRLRLVVERADGVQVFGYRPHYRMRVYAPKSQQSVAGTEADLLSPAAGAPHSDAFAVSTLPEFTDVIDETHSITYKPYLDTISGRKGELDLLEKSTDKGSMTVTLLDKRLAVTSNRERWWTAFTGDAGGRNQLAACRVEIDRSLNGGTSWSRYFTGRVTSDALDGPVIGKVVVRDMMEEQENDVFVGTPHSSITYATVSQLSPIGITGDYGTYDLPDGTTAQAFAQVDPLIGTVRLGVDGHAKVLEMDGRRRRVNAITMALANMAIGGAFRNWSDNFAIRFDFPSGAADVVIDALGTFPLKSIYAHLPGTQEEKQWRVTGIWAEGFDDVAAWGSGDRVPSVRIVKVGPPTEATPLLVGPVHPVQLWQDMLDGKFGYLDDVTGDPLQTVAYDAAAFAALIADASIPEGTWLIDDIDNLADWVEDNICKAYGLGQRLSTEGKVVPLDLRISKAFDATILVTDDDVIAEDENAGDSRDAEDAITRVKATYAIDHQVGDDEIEGHNPDIPPCSIESQEQPLIVVDNSGRSRDLGDHPYEIKATGYRAFVRQDGTLVGRDVVEAKLLDLIDEIRPPFATGSHSVPLFCMPTAVVQSIEIGTFCRIDVTKLRNPATNGRGGEQLACCVGRSEDDDGLGVHLDFAMLGLTGDRAEAPTLGVPALGTDTFHSGSVPVTLNAALMRAAVRWIATPKTTAVRPADSDPGWRHAGYAYATGDFAVTNLPSGSRIWWEARSVPTSADQGVLPSAWAYAAAPGYFDTDTLTAPGAITAAAAWDRVAITWPNTETDYPIDVLVNGAVRTTLAPGTTRYTFLNVSGGFTAGLRYRDQYGGVSSTTTAAVAPSGAVTVAPRPAGIDVRGEEGGDTGTVPLSTGSGLVGSESGIIVTAFPSDPAFLLEIERAPDVAGAADEANAVSLGSDIEPSSPVLVDFLPLDGATRWYRARAGYPGASSSDWTCWKPGVPMVLPFSITAAAPVLPVVQAQSSRTATVGTLDLTVADDQCRLTKVEMKSRSGDGGETAYAEVALAGGVYSGTVNLVEGQTSTISYRWSGYNADGVLGVLGEQTVIFAAAGAPSPPQLTARFTSSGTLIVDVNGGPLQASVKVYAANTGEPTDATVRAQTAVDGRTVTISTGLTFSDGDVVTVKAFAYSGAGGTGEESAKAVITATYHAGAGVATPITIDDETATIPGSRQLVAGTGTTIDTSTAGQVKINASGTATPSAIGFEFGDGVTAPSANAIAGGRIPFACTITEADIWADTSGSAVVDIQTSADGVTYTSIAASAKPTLSSAQSVQDTTLTGWTTAIAAGTWVRGVLQSVDAVLKQVAVQLKLVKS